MTLPMRIAQNRHAALESFNDAYFEFLKRTGCNALYLQNAPFDPMRTGNKGQFFRHFHLISLFDIARSHRRIAYQDYINEICLRAGRHGIGVWLDCWEPRLPAYAQSMTPPDWRGRGGWDWHGDKRIAFCWEQPDAVAYWKSMARDAFAALPHLEGAIVSMIDNEACFCEESCPHCQGRSRDAGILDVFRTFRELAEAREQPLRIAMYDWWMPKEVIGQIMAELPKNSLVIGRSTRGIHTAPPDGAWEGAVADISNVVDGNADDFAAHCRKARTNGLIPIDMVAWSRGMENFFLPAPPDPLFAIRKCKALQADGADGWMDYDCGNLEPGSIAEAVCAFTAEPEADEALLLDSTLRAVWATDRDVVRTAYERYREARRWLPTGLHSKNVNNLDARLCGMGFCLMAPWQLEDFRFYDTYHAFNYFALYNLLTEDTLALLLRPAQECERLLAEAWHTIQPLKPATESARRDHAAFEIHWRNALSICGYIQLATAKLRHLRGELPVNDYRDEVRTIAVQESDNLDAIVAWVAAHPGVLGNPCHQIVGHLSECWRDADFSEDLFEPKRRSLAHLRESFDPSEWIPGYVIQQAL